MVGTGVEDGRRVDVCTRNSGTAVAVQVGGSCFNVGVAVGSWSKPGVGGGGKGLIPLVGLVYTTSIRIPRMSASASTITAMIFKVRSFIWNPPWIVVPTNFSV
jgi:hypothetical protein